MKALLAILELKGILTNEEAEAMAEHFDSNPQSTHYDNMLYDVKQILKPFEKKQCCNSNNLIVLLQH